MEYISISTIMDKIMLHPLMLDMSLDVALTYAIEFIRIMGMPKLLEQKTAVLDVKDYMADLPCDYYDIIQLRYPCSRVALRYATSSFEPEDDDTYKILGRVLHTSMKEGQLEMAYTSMPLDDEGIPMVVDNAAFLRALELYIKKQWFTILFDTNKISPQVYLNTKLEYAWAVGQALEVLNTPTVDQMESLSNMWNTLLPRMQEHRRAFVTLGTKEYIKRQ